MIAARANGNSFLINDLARNFLRFIGLLTDTIGTTADSVKASDHRPIVICDILAGACVSLGGFGAGVWSDIVTLLS